MLSGARLHCVSQNGAARSLAIFCEYFPQPRNYSFPARLPCTILAYVHLVFGEVPRLYIHISISCMIVRDGVSLVSLVRSCTVVFVVATRVKFDVVA